MYLKQFLGHFVANIFILDNAKVFFARTHAISHVLIVALACIFASAFMPTTKAVAQTKTLKLYYLHTREKNTITYYKNGKYINSALKKVNWALRDWRLNEPTKMDPKLLDLVWEAYRRSGSKAYIHVISGYRSPVTNEKLRKRGGGQAKKSQHTRGKALDFYLPDVKISKMRSIGLKMGVGGVGYYPRSGSPFVHLDTGNVRHWPRMTRKQLAKVFPKGKTMHIPTDGKPLARYKVAVAEYKSRSKKGTKIPTSSKKELNFFQRLAAKANSDEKADEVQSAPILPRTVKTVKAPSPRPEVVQAVVGTASAPKEIERAAPLSITEPVPEPKIPEAPEPQFAILAERKIPLPLASPRNVITPIGSPDTNKPIVEEPIVVAVLEPEKVGTDIKAQKPVQKPLETVPSQEEVQDAQEEIQEKSLALSNSQDLNIPLPVKRPQVKTEPDIQIASLEPVKQSQILKLPKTLNQPALTANEIADLRRSTTPKLKKPTSRLTQVTKTIAQKPIAQKPVAIKAEPKVIEPITQEKPALGKQIALSNDTPSSDKLSSDTLRTTKDFVKGDARLTNDTTSKQNTLDEVITPKTKAEPALIPEVTKEPEIVIALNNIPIPTRNPRYKLNLPTLQKEKTVIASLDKKAATNTNLGKRTISLDKFSAPQDNKSSIGQYALASNFNIRDLNAVKAPVYGRNAIRKAPEAVFKDGFRNSTDVSLNYGFSGKAVVFKKFARLAK